MNTFSVPEKLMQDILNYLSARPYAEVYQLVEGVLSLNNKPKEAAPEASAEAPKAE